MRRDLRAHGDPACLRGSYRCYGLPRREVHYMQRTLLVCSKGAVTLDHHRFRHRRPACEAESRRDRAFVHLAVARQRWLLLVERQHPPRHPAVLKSSLHEAGRHDRMAVIGESGGPEAGELGHLAQFLAPETLRDRRHEAGRDRRLRSRKLDQRSKHRGRIDDRIGVRHREDRAIATGGRRRRA